MTPKRFYFLLLGILVLVIGLTIAGTVGGNALLEKQAAKLHDLKVQHKTIEEQKVLVAQAKKDIEKYSELNNIAKSIVPQDKDQAKTVRELSKIAAESGIELKSITFQASNLGQAAPAPPPSSAEEGGAAAPKPKTPAISQVKPVEGIPGVYSLEITISPNETKPVPYSKFLGFLERLEGNRRTAHVNKITLSPNANGSALTFILTLNAYVKP